MRAVRRPSHRPLLLQEPDLFELLWQADGGALDVSSRAPVGGLLKDRVMPKVPYRQWVVSLPGEGRDSGPSLAPSAAHAGGFRL
jgi:hypothetical protein